VFVQEFVRIDVPLMSVVDAFEATVVPRFGALLRDAWVASGSGTGPSPAKPPVPVAVGGRRDRVDGVAYAIAWPSLDPSFPAFDADIELAAVSPAETHLEFAGQSTYPFVEPWSVEARRVNRQCMAAIDRLLRSVAALVEASVRSVP
jgi:hypothetical protein